MNYIFDFERPRAKYNSLSNQIDFMILECEDLLLDYQLDIDNGYFIEDADNQKKGIIGKLKDIFDSIIEWIKGIFNKNKKIDMEEEVNVDSGKVGKIRTILNAIKRFFKSNLKMMSEHKIGTFIGLLTAFAGGTILIKDYKANKPLRVKKKQLQKLIDECDTTISDAQEAISKYDTLQSDLKSDKIEEPKGKWFGLKKPTQAQMDKYNLKKDINFDKRQKALKEIDKKKAEIKATRIMQRKYENDKANLDNEKKHSTLLEAFNAIATVVKKIINSLNQAIHSGRKSTPSDTSNANDNISGGDDNE